MLKDAVTRLSRHTVIYAVAGQASRLLSFLLIPFYTTYLKEQDYGIIEMLSLMLSVLAFLAGVNMANAMSRFYFEKPDLAHRQTVVSTALISVAGAALIVAGLLALAANPIGRLLGADFPGMTHLVLVTLGILVLQTVREMYFQYLRLGERSTLFTVVSLAKLAVELSFQIWFVAWLHLGVLGLFYAVLIGEGLTLLLMSCLVLPVTGLRFSPSLFNSMALFVLPLVPTGLLQFCLHSGDRYILRAATDNTQVGIYSLAYKFGYIPNYLLLTPFMMIWFPYIFSLENDDARRQLIGRIMPYFMFGMTACCLVTSLLAREAVTLMAQQPGFHAAWPAVPLVCAGYWFWSFFLFVQTVFLIVKRTNTLLVLTGIAVAINLILNLLLVPQLGLMGAAWATMVTFALLVAIGVRAVRSVFPIAWQWRRVVIPGLSASALCLTLTLADLRPGTVSISIKLVAFVVWLSWMCAGGFLKREERLTVIAALRNIRWTAGRTRMAEAEVGGTARR